MFVENLINARGNKVVNQFIINHNGEVWFQSYRSVVAHIDSNGVLTLSANWDFSHTTIRHLYNFLRQNHYNGDNVELSKRNVEKLINDGIVKYNDNCSLNYAA